MIKRKAKIIATLGPSCQSLEEITAIIKAGMNIARLNFSHGTLPFHRTIANRIRTASAQLGMPVAILQDLQGPKMRCGLMTGGAIELIPGKKCIVTIDKMLGTAKKFCTQYQDLIIDVKVGDRILFDDGRLQMEVLKKLNEKEIQCVVEVGGILKDNKGINLPNSATNAPSLTPKDIRDLHFGAEIGVDAVALSFVRNAEDLRVLKRELAHAKTRPLVFAKIEKPQALENLSEILDECDGVMVARGDLGVELPPEEVPIHQKEIIVQAKLRGKLTVVATQMLESMIQNPRPTRAEASDVANAVLDGADMLMLSAESASGDYPQESVQMMDRIIRYAEKSQLAQYFQTKIGLLASTEQLFQNAAALSAVRASQELSAKAIAVYTASGATAGLVSGYRPNNEIIAYVPDLRVQRRLCFLWGVRSCIQEAPKQIESLFATINDQLMGEEGYEAGDILVTLTKVPLQASQRTNTLHIHALKRNPKTD